MKYLKTLISAVIFYASVWAGFIEGFEGAQNVAAFIVWAVYLPLSLLCTTEAVQQSAASRPDSTNPLRPLYRILNAAALGAMVWHGAIFTALAYAVSWLLMASFQCEVDKLRAAHDAQPQAQAQ